MRLLWFLNDHYLFFLNIYQKGVLDILKTIDDRNPFLRGIISQIGLPLKKVEFKYKKRIHGKTKNNYSVLYDCMFLGLMHHTKAPLRFIFISGVFGFFCNYYDFFNISFFKAK